MLSWAFFWEIVKFNSFSELFDLKFIFGPELSGMSYPDPDPANGFGSDRIRILNTGYDYDLWPIVDF
jgi:hypothetical protein